jgi:UDPglucose 6-dehydrogenase
MNVLIIGYGVVGQNMHNIFQDAEIWDTEKVKEDDYFKNYEGSMTKTYDIAFVCVPTPMRPDGTCNTMIVGNAILKHRRHVRLFCIKSTIAPGTTKKLNYIEPLINNDIIFSPEYFGATQHANSHDYDFVILGGHRDACAVVARAYEEVSTADLKIYQTDSTTAELVKYMENSWLAMKVSFCNEFARIADRCNVDYRELRELWLADPRINPSHTFVYKDNPYYDSHCLSKDIPAIIEASTEAGYTPGLLRAMQEYNDKWRRLHGGTKRRDNKENSTG